MEKPDQQQLEAIKASQQRNGKIYAIIDNKTDEIIGGLHIHKHHASAVRYFNDILSYKGSMPNMHPTDFDLWQLGTISELNELYHDKELVQSGSAWASLNAATTTTEDK